MSGAAPRSVGRIPRTRERTLPYPRVARASSVRLSRKEPTVTLTRLQSGLGALAVSWRPGASAGDAAVGMVLETDDGVLHVVQALGDALRTPERPLPLVRRDPDGTLLLDLRQVRRLRRFLVYGYSPSVTVVGWDGLLTVTTRDGSRVEVPVDLEPMSGTVAMLTGYQVHGELVLRAEDELVAGPPEQTARRYGYTYPWLDGTRPSR